MNSVEANRRLISVVCTRWRLAWRVAQGKDPMDVMLMGLRALMFLLLRRHRQ